MASQIPETSTERILAAARALLQKHPAAPFTMARLAGETGLSRATLYRAVGSREALLSRLAREEGVDPADFSQPDIPTRILAAVRQVIAQIGSLNVTIEQVAEEAGVGVATVYRHFGDKESLLQAFADRFTPRRAAQKLMLDPGPHMEDDLIAFAARVLEFMIDNHDLSRLLFAFDEKARTLLNSLRSRQDRTMKTLAAYFQKQIDQGRLPVQDPFDLATAFIGTLFGFVFLKPGYIDPGSPLPDRREIGRIARLTTHLILDGARRHQADPGETA